MHEQNKKNFSDNITGDLEIPDINAPYPVRRNKLYLRLKSYRSGDRKRSQLTGKKSMCDWTPLEFKEAILNGKCEYCNDASWNILGLDRMDNTIGHTKVNTVLCCRTCNSIKGNDDNEIGFTKMKKLGKIVEILKTMGLDDNEGRKTLKLIGKNLYPKPKKQWQLKAELEK